MSEIRLHSTLITLGTQELRPAGDNELWRLLDLVSDLYWQEDEHFVCRSVRCEDTHDNRTLYADLPGRTLWDFGIIPMSDHTAPVQHLELRRDRKSFTDHLFRFNHQGGTRYLRVSGDPQFNPEGLFLGYHCLARDVTHQREIEQRLQRFRAAMDMSSDMIYLVDRETLRYVDVNDTACRLAGMSREELLKQGPANVLAESEDQIRARYDRLIREGGSSRIENRTLSSTGEPVVVEVYSRATKIDDRWIIIGMTRDVTKRKRAEESSRRLQQMFSALCETNEAILRAKSVQMLYQNVCNAAIKGGKFSIAAIVGPTRNGWLRMLSGAGTTEHIVHRTRISIDPDRPEGQGLAGIAFRTEQPCISNDYLNDKRTALWREAGRIQNIASAAAFPLFKRGRCIAILLFYASEKDAFDADIVKLLENMAENVSYALDSFESEAERKQAEAVLRESEERFRSLTNLSSDFYWEQDELFHFTKYEGKIIGQANTQAVENLIGKPLWEIPGLKPGSTSWNLLRHTMQQHAQVRDFEFAFTNSDQELYHLSISGEPRYDDFGRFIGYRGISRDITERKRISDHIKYLATHDHLTDLPNRVMFGELLEQATKTARRYPTQSFAILFIDLDRFKSVNDTYGHHIGDSLLKEVAVRLRAPLRASDVVARLGGDEFVILLQNVSGQDQIEKIAQNVLGAFNSTIVLAGKECRVTASIGISVFGSDANDEETLMKHADAAMYIAKEEGKNTYQFYSMDIHIRTQEKISLELHLRDALARQELSLHYQAKLDLVTGLVKGVEALLRWDSHALGSISPDRFIPIAEETGQIIEIGDWVLLNACEQLAEWQRRGMAPLTLAVNLSVRQFNDPSLLDRIQDVLASTGLAPELLELEITESVVIHNPERAFRLMSQIKALGVRLAIDDFGTGYSSLGKLRNYPIDTLKIDRVFIQDMPIKEADRAITRAIISMGRTLGLTIVAEGVEMAEQMQFLREHQCDLIQGFYFHRPIDGAGFEEWLSAHDPTLFQTEIALLPSSD